MWRAEIDPGGTELGILRGDGRRSAASSSSSRPSFEGPDGYARAGGIASRIEGLAQALDAAGQDTHLWFIGDPLAPGRERRGTNLELHRWCQWISAYHPAGVYDGERGKERDYARSLPPVLLRDHLRPAIERGQRPVVLAEEWHTVHAVLHLDWLLRREGLREHVEILWNANNRFGFEGIEIRRAARRTSRDYPWSTIVARNLLPRVGAPRTRAGPEARTASALQVRREGALASASGELAAGA